MPSRIHRQLSLYELLHRVVSHGDSEALAEFHDHRTVFSWGSRHRIRCAEYLDLLRENAADFSFASEAYQHCLDKFLHFPDEDNGTDCRHYFRAALDKLPGDLAPLEKEEQLAHILRNQVTAHFKLSCKDRLRTLGGFSRYTWELAQGSLRLMMPKTVSGPARKQWLESHVPDVDPSRPGEQQRVQGMIDEAFASGETYQNEWIVHQNDTTPLPWEYTERLQMEQLSSVVAAEKADRISEQRPAIRKLGTTKLRQLVLAAFENIARPQSGDSVICQDFGLSKASFSRFAGSNWTQNMPDLWRNTAQLLQHHPVFRELAAAYAGIAHHITTNRQNP